MSHLRVSAAAEKRESVHDGKHPVGSRTFPVDVTVCYYLVNEMERKQVAAEKMLCNTLKIRKCQAGGGWRGHISSVLCPLLCYISVSHNSSDSRLHFLMVMKLLCPLCSTYWSSSLQKVHFPSLKPELQATHLAPSWTNSMIVYSKLCLLGVTGRFFLAVT